jgi:chemotaxis protein CheZ
MPVRRKVFRIEEWAGMHRNAGEHADAPEHVLAELAALRSLLERGVGTHGSEGGTPVEVDSTRLRQSNDETDAINQAISRTRQEIAALACNGLVGPEGSRACRELDAAIATTRQAIERILAAAEAIDDAANTLSASLRQAQEQALAQDIRDQATRIFEACNFDDVASQRIGKVLTTLKSVEDHVARMNAIWSGIDAFKHFPLAAPAGCDPAPLNGPRLDDDLGHASQDDIDALFRNQ